MIVIKNKGSDLKDFFILKNNLLFSEIGDFQKIVGTFIEVVDNVAKEVEKEKMKVRLWIHIFTVLENSTGQLP